MEPEAGKRMDTTRHLVGEKAPVKSQGYTMIHLEKGRGAFQIHGVRETHPILFVGRIETVRWL
ncbi:hypothetical protein GCM10010872_19610 [Dyella flava]|nr:hypothetical protein GCM10010872_19610 [Dyella flava]